MALEDKLLNLNKKPFEQLNWTDTGTAFTDFGDIAHVDPIGSPIIYISDDDDKDYWVDFVVDHRPKKADAYSVGIGVYDEKTKKYYLPVQYYKIRQIEGC